MRSAAARRSDPAGRTARVLADARALTHAGDALPRSVDHRDLRATLAAITESIATALDDVGDDGRRAALVATGLEAQDVLTELEERDTARRLELRGAVREGLARLRHIGSSAELLDRVCAEVARSCSVSRVLLSRVNEGVWFPWMAHFEADAELGRSFAELLRGGLTIDLNEAPIERAVLAARRPRIVRDVGGDHAYGPLIFPSQSTSYVVAPITPAGRVVGFLHADCHPHQVTEVERDVLWTFSEGFGRIYERLELHERLRAQRSRVHESFEVVESITSALEGADIELTRHAEERLSPDEADTRALVARSAIEELLTEREREVLALMVRGYNNAAIAERLVVKDGTVKSHVKHILRKLGAVNRAEVIALSLGRTGSV